MEVKYFGGIRLKVLRHMKICECDLFFQFAKLGLSWFCQFASPMVRSSRLEMIFKTVVLKNSANFAEKHLC